MTSSALPSDVSATLHELPPDRNEVVSTPRSAGERYGWAYASFWLVFLVFPAIALVSGDRSTAQKAFGIALIVAFGAVYIRANRRLPVMSSTQARVYLGALTAIALAAASVLGPDALALAPFICSWAMMALPRRWGIFVALASTVVSIVMAALIDWNLVMFTFIIVVVSIATGAVAGFIQSGNQVHELLLSTRLASDRERVARDVHDVLGHSLTAVVVKSELAQRLVLTDPTAALRELTEIEALSRSALAEIRTTVGGLRASRLSDEISMARRLLSSAGISLDAPEPGTAEFVDVDQRARTIAAWTVREATTNIVRHSGARNATIRWGNDFIEVIDDGRGFAHQAAKATEGNGLAGLRERVAAFGGSVLVGPGPNGVGTRIRVELE